MAGSAEEAAPPGLVPDAGICPAAIREAGFQGRFATSVDVSNGT
jgi:hypothetical protein